MQSIEHGPLRPNMPPSVDPVILSNQLMVGAARDFELDLRSDHEVRDEVGYRFILGVYAVAQETGLTLEPSRLDSLAEAALNLAHAEFDDKPVSTKRVTGVNWDRWRDLMTRRLNDTRQRARRTSPYGYPTQQLRTYLEVLVAERRGDIAIRTQNN